MIGASGAGKDTLVQWARRELPPASPIRIVEREITRDRGPEEHHVPVTALEFEQRKAAGHYLLHWAAHGVQYGLPRIDCAGLERGQSVLTIASRTMLEAVRALACPAHFIEIRAPYAVLEQRLRKRGGRPGSEIAGRLSRASAFPVEGPDVHVIDNGGALSESGRAFVSLLVRLAMNGQCGY